MNNDVSPYKQILVDKNKPPYLHFESLFYKSNSNYTRLFLNN